MREEEIVYLGIAPVHVDIMCRADGIDTEGVVARAVHVKVGELEVPLIGRDDLLANKRASGRPQDVADVAAIERASR